MEEILEINKVLKGYFDNPGNPRCVAAKDLMDLFVRRGIFEKDRAEGLPIRKLLRELDKLKQLYKIPYVHPERKTKNTYWYFVARDEVK